MGAYSFWICTLSATDGPGDLTVTFKLVRGLSSTTYTCSSPIKTPTYEGAK